MAKFCTKCGKSLEEGQVCTCSNTVVSQPAAATVAATSTGFDFNQCLNSYIEIVKGIFVKPVDTIQKFATSSNFVLGMIAIVLNCIISAILLYCFASESIGLIGSLLGGFGGFGSFGSVGSLMDLGGFSIEVPFMSTFLHGLLFMATGFVVTALMIYLIAGVILKDKIDIKKSFALIGVCSVFTTITTVVAIILNYISMGFMFVVLLIAGIFYLTHLYQGLSEVTEVNKNKLAYVFVPAVSVATFIVVYVLPKILM